MICVNYTGDKQMTHNTTHDHPVGRGFMLFGITASALAWTVFVVWTVFMMLIQIARN